MGFALWDVWPFNVSSGPLFLLIYAGLSVAVLVLARLWTQVIGTASDGHAYARARALAAKEASSPSGLSAYRRPADPHQRFTMGTLPRGDELWAIAHLRAGDTGVSDLLLATALASGWLYPVPEVWNGLALAASAVSNDPVSDRFIRALRADPAAKLTYINSRWTAREVAKGVGPDLRRQLEKVGLIRGAAVRTAMTVVLLVTGTVLNMVAMVRITRGLSLGRPVGLLVFELLVAAMTTCVLAFLAYRSRSMIGAAYLRWLRDVTPSLKADVAGGRRQDPREVGLVVAAFGLGSIYGAPILPDGWSSPEPRSPSRSASSTAAPSAGSASVTSTCASTSSSFSASSCGGGGGGGSGGGGSSGGGCGG
jgi:uncharacterized protein (TIGR04222 family)